MTDLAAAKERRLKIVSVGSSEDVQIVISLSLGMDENITVHLVSSYVKYWEIVNGGMRPDVVLVAGAVDIGIPMRLVKDIKNSLPHLSIPVIVLRANGSAREQQAFYEAGAIGVIFMPFDPLTLADEIRRILQDDD